MSDTVRDAGREGRAAQEYLSTPSQTVGPFFHLGMPRSDGPYVVSEDDPDVIVIEGTVYDGAGEAVPDAVIETWQADARGRFAHPDDPRGAVDSGFRGFGRCPTDPQGRFRIFTHKPGAVPGPSGPQAPHIDVSVFARGLLHRLVTRIYLAEDTAAHAADPVLSAIDDPEHRATLIAVPDESAAGGVGSYRFDIRLQGDRETVFFDV